jgi:hypothetical protein
MLTQLSQDRMWKHVVFPCINDEQPSSWGLFSLHYSTKFNSWQICMTRFRRSCTSCILTAALLSKWTRETPFPFSKTIRRSLHISSPIQKRRSRRGTGEVQEKVPRYWGRMRSIIRNLQNSNEFCLSCWAQRNTWFLIF